MEEPCRAPAGPPRFTFTPAAPAWLPQTPSLPSLSSFPRRRNVRRREPRGRRRKNCAVASAVVPLPPLLPLGLADPPRRPEARKCARAVRPAGAAGVVVAREGGGAARRVLGGGARGAPQEAVAAARHLFLLRLGDAEDALRRGVYDGAPLRAAGAHPRADRPGPDRRRPAGGRGRDRRHRRVHAAVHRRAAARVVCVREGGVRDVDRARRSSTASRRR